MATITVAASNVTANELCAANWELARINAQRTADGLATFPTMLAYLEWKIANVELANWAASQTNAIIAETKLYERFVASTDSQRTAALAQLAAAPS